MNVIELLVVVSLIASGFFVGRFLGRPFGLLGWCGGALLGVALWVALFWVIRILLKRVEQRYPPRPVCRRGKCSVADYKFVQLADGGVDLMCHCGDKYNAKSNRFMMRSEDGSSRPYMRRRNCFSKWENDSE